MARRPAVVPRASAAALLACPGAALAHSPLPGIEGFYVGFLHPAGAPEPLLCAIALGMLLGVHGPVVARPAWGLFALALGAGLAWSFTDGARTTLAWLPLAVALAAALACVVAPRPDSRTGTWTAVGLGAAAGIAIGLGSVPDPGPTGAVLVTVAGSFVGANFLLLLVFGAVDFLREHLPSAWIQLGARIAAGWLVAIVMMLLALAWQP
ncbi:MAG: hypothetical protein KF911_04865 [Pseudomonadales bacterium]|nr:hypothetical protein [Pseudomonadales bacterium]